MPAVKKSRPSFAVAVLKQPGKPCEYRIYLKQYGYGDDWITDHLNALDRAFAATEERKRKDEESRKEMEKERIRLSELSALQLEPESADRHSDGPSIASTARRDAERGNLPSSNQSARRGNPIAIDRLPAKASLKREKMPVKNDYGIPVIKSESGRCTIFEEATSTIFRWCGSKGWSEKECILLMKNLDIEGVSIASLPILLKAGAKGFRVPDLNKEQEALLKKCVGKK